MQYRRVKVLGGKGEGPDRFRAALRGIAVDDRGQIYAAGDSEIKVFDAAGACTLRWRTAKPPISVAVAERLQRAGAEYPGRLRRFASR